MGRIRRVVTPANVIASMALFVALGGTGWAAQVIGNNSVGTPQLKSNAVSAPKLAEQCGDDAEDRERRRDQVEDRQGRSHDRCHRQGRRHAPSKHRRGRARRRVAEQDQHRELGRRDGSGEQRRHRRDGDLRRAARRRSAEAGTPASTASRSPKGRPRTEPAGAVSFATGFQQPATVTASAVCAAP